MNPLLHPSLCCLQPQFSSTLSFSTFFVLLCFSGKIFGRVARRPPVSTVDGGVLSRLLTPTQASLARSKSAAALSAEGTDAPGNLRLGDADREEGWLATHRLTSLDLTPAKCSLQILGLLEQSIQRECWPLGGGGIKEVTAQLAVFKNCYCNDQLFMLCTVVTCGKVQSCERA